MARDGDGLDASKDAGESVPQSKTAESLRHGVGLQGFNFTSIHRRSNSASHVGHGLQQKSF